MFARRVLSAAAVCVGVAASAGTIGDSFMLETAHTAMAFEKDARGTWRLLHYGSRTGSLADARKLAWNGYAGENAMGQRVPATYCTFGQKNRNATVSKGGGLSVIHADGVLTTDLLHEKAETVADAPGVVHLVLTLKDAAYPFRVFQHFRALEKCDVVETWVELEHGEPAAVKLVRMDSLAILLPNLAQEYHLTSLTGVHYSDNQLVESEIPMGRTTSLAARSGVRDAWGANPAFMLGIGGKPTETTGAVIGGVLCWSGSWSMSFDHDFVHHLEVRGGADTASGPYTLDPGRRLVLPKFALTYSPSGKGAVSRNLHRWARYWQLPAGHKLRPIPMCSWVLGFSFDEAKLKDLMAASKEIGCELFVLDDGWFGHGKYARDPKHGDRVGLGDWHVNRELIPGGLDGLSAAAKGMGIDFGIWVEPEMANTNSWLYEAHPDWPLREKTRPLYARRGNSQVVLDYTNPAVRENIFTQLDALYGSIPGLAYVKWDANADFGSIGSSCLPPDRQANVWFDYTRGLEEVLGRLRRKYPAIDIQACGSGGGRTDYGFLRYADEFWASDNCDPRERVFIQWGASLFYPASTIASHVAPCPNWHMKRTTPIKYRCDVAMSARYGYEFDPRKMSPEEFAVSKAASATYKRIRPTVQQGDLYRLVSPYEQSYAALMYVNDARSHAVVFLFGLSRSGRTNDFPPPLRLEGLSPDVNYTVRELNTVKQRHSQLDGKSASGRAFMTMGLPVRFDPGDWDSAVFELTGN